jgi:2-dehydro-3-deoxyphosphogluconate aldolase/(4S)-4-hydroxy-2-oxoglutarate aldolase
MNAIFEKIGSLKLVPVVVLPKADDASPLADALLKGGLPIAEVTFRTGAAVDAIRTLSKRGDLLVGAGTVLNVDQVKQSVDNGAKFIIAPGFSEKIVTYCIEKNIPILPGIATPSEVTLALEMGLDVLKFFPADTLGGVKTLKAMSAPFSMVKFVPTGGIHETNLTEYLQFPKVLACAGSWMVKDVLIKEKRFDEIERLTREAVALAKSVK